MPAAPPASPVSSEKAKRWISGILLAYLLAAGGVLLFIDGAAARTLSAATMAALILIVSFSFLLRCLRWCVIARFLVPGVRRVHLLQVYIGGFPMVLTPGRVGEVWRAWVLSTRWGVAYRRGFPLIFCDRLLDLLALLLFAALGVFSAGVYRLPAMLAIAALSPLLLLAFKPRWGFFLIKNFWAATGKWNRRHAAALLTVCRRITDTLRSSYFFPALALSLLAWATEAFAISVVVASLDGALSLANAMKTLGLANIAGVLTFLPAGIGGQEATMSYLIYSNGNTMEIALITAIAVKVGTVFYASLLGLPFFLKLSRRNLKATPAPQALAQHGQIK